MQTFLLSGCMGPCALFFRCQDATASITHLAKGIIIKLIVSHLEVSLNLRIVLRMWAFARSSEHPLNLHALDPSVGYGALATLRLRCLHRTSSSA